MTGKFKKIFNNKTIAALENNVAGKIFIAIITIIVLSLFLPSYKNIDIEFEVGTIWSSEDLIAPFTFPIYQDEEVYQKEKQEVLQNTIPVFLEVNNSKISVYNDSVQIYLNSLSRKVKDISDKINPENESSFEFDFDALNNEFSVSLSREQWIYLAKYYKGDFKESISHPFPEVLSLLQRNMSESYRKNIIDYDKDVIKSQKIFVKKYNEKAQRIESLDKVFSRKEIISYLELEYSAYLNDTALTAIIIGFANALIKDNLAYSSELTDLEVQNRIDQIPKTIGIVRENERIISKHDPITDLTKLKLESYKRIRLERIGVKDYFSQYVGKVLMIVILLSVLTMFMFFIRNDIYRNNIKLALISSLILLVSFFAFISMQLKVNAPVELLIFISVASMLLTILFDSRLAFFTIVITCFLVAAVRGGDYTIAFISFCGSVLAIFSVRDIKNRSQIFRSFFFILGGYSVAILAIGFDRTESSSKILVNLLYGSLNSVMSPVIAYGLLIFYEKVFRITTDLTLVELADFNQPLLKELSTNAPGTFHHSVVMGNLAEEAAAAIGANRILARVGCYYHDIGKIAKPSFFVENQLERINKHETLNPTLSAKIIISHIKDGIELGRKYKLPVEVINFIPMHHGTTLVSYFYNKARTSVDENKEDIHDYIYRYPGPKPQTKETAIAMLADTVEASTKAIEDPTPKKLEDKIDEIIKKRFIEGELDECELTLRDLTKIKKSFLNILVGIYHQRIKYPEMKPSEV